MTTVPIDRRGAGTLLLGLLAGLRGSAAQASGATPAMKPVPARYFGIHLHHLLVQPGDAHPATPWPSLPFASIRLWDSYTRWPDLAPSPGQWAFDRLDAYINAAASHGAEVLYTLGMPPRWASKHPDEPSPYGPGEAAEPLRLAHWEEYVRRVVQRYRGRIAAYEVWNEPNFSELARDRNQPGFYTGSLATMLEMTRIAREQLKANDPAARLLSPGFVNGVDRLEMFLAGGGKAWVDGVAYHFYAADDLDFERQVAAVRAAMRRQGLEEAPLWNTECGVDKAGIDTALRAARIAQLHIVGAASGLDRFHYYAWDNDRYGLTAAVDPSGRSQRALQQVQHWLTASTAAPMQRLAGGVAYCQQQHADASRSLLVWSPAPAMQAVPVPEGWEAVAIEDLSGTSRPLTASTTLHIALSPAPQRVTLRAVGSAPLPVAELA